MVFLDTNVVLELILKDRPHIGAASQFLTSLTDDTAISMLTVHLIMHFGGKSDIASTVLESVIGENELLSIIPEDYVWASLHEQGKDFEDALQVATAIRNGCESFITFDISLARRYKNMPIMIIIPSLFG